ncbi:hypothetical protein [Streptomyces peucetius]|uniref:Uncharacterized protein n=1 Tax=Streptomyces peucetius TaxID=1950 RepID=A0ABY6I4I1_STRPE|nr:hypothetical protein [Streptomyces peucetius]UYQ61887.1 hypothetical protein OGH68_10550 [Streptomyces peucetius]
MVEIAVPIIAALLGGTAAFWLTTWWNRPRLDLTLVSIAKDRDPDDQIEISPRTKEISDSFLVGPSLQNISPCSDVTETRNQSEQLRDGASSQIELAKEFKRRLRNCHNKEEKVEFIEELLSPPSSLIYMEIRSGLRRRALSPSPGQAREREPLFDLHEKEMSDRSIMYLELPNFYHPISYDSPIGDVDLQRIRPLVEAMRFFDRDALRECLEFAIQGIRADQARADTLVTKLGDALESGPYRISMIVVNKGAHTALLSPYGALKTSGATFALEPLPLRATKMIDGKGNCHRISESSYVSLEPKSANTVILESDPMDGASPLGAAFNKRLLNCSAVVVQIKRGIRGKPKKKTIWTTTKEFGANLSGELRQHAMEVAKPSS